jgi:hypothetical protein
MEYFDKILSLPDCGEKGFHLIFRFPLLAAKEGFELTFNKLLEKPKF